MNKPTDQEPKKTLTLSKKLDVKKVVESDQVRQSFSHGRTKTVSVEVKRKRVSMPGEIIEEKPIEKSPPTSPPAQEPEQDLKKATTSAGKRLTEDELTNRLKVVQDALKTDALEAGERARREAEEAEWRRQMEQLALEKQQEKPPAKEKSPSESEEAPSSQEGTSSDLTRHKPDNRHPAGKTYAPTYAKNIVEEDEDEDAGGRRKGGARIDAKKNVGPAVKKEFDHPRKLDRQSITRALSGEEESRGRSLASLRRARQKHKQLADQTEQLKVIREVIIPDTITVGELANRMAVRGADVIKSLMKLGMMVTINQPIDADTAELLCSEFGHKFKRISESDIELGLRGEEDKESELIHRAPVVTVMGHVDHGKTSLLDALRKTDVVSGEAGGITQHIGAYQVTLRSGQKITFIDTPGHAAFTEMRARGANVTDIVVLVVAADDGIMEQTIEAIHHAKAAKVPMVVAINKMDKPEANPSRVRSELLQHEVVLEEFGGDILSVEVSAKKLMNLDLLEEKILLQAEVLDLKSNPSRAAEGVVIEAQIDKGRGTVATILIQRGTLKVGDIFVAGTEWGRVRALINDHGQKIETATPAMPVEILGFNGVPSAGDEFFVVETEARAREVAEFRQRRERDAKVAASARSSMEQMMTQIASGEARELPLVIKSDVQGSLEAIQASLGKLSTEEVNIRVLHGGVGGINESDVTLARASGGIVIGFNVRTNPQARELARRDNVEIRYYSIIYDVIDDMKALMSGLLAPTLREKFLGFVEIRQVFSISKIGKVAGCYVTEGVVKRGARIRLLRDNVVIHEGALQSLKRFKDEVKEVKESYECGIVLENYNDIQEKDIIECYEIESVARQI
ncbi:MAG: translation initiation factor IF-2 [Alphaproteobacteria bacterium]|nr:translation initiation factor IF-2 [Alphaproteobacteria bacterium]